MIQCRNQDLERKTHWKTCTLESHGRCPVAFKWCLNNKQRESDRGTQGSTPSYILLSSWNEFGQGAPVSDDALYWCITKLLRCNRQSYVMRSHILRLLPCAAGSWKLKWLKWIFISIFKHKMQTNLSSCQRLQTQQDKYSLSQYEYMILNVLYSRYVVHSRLQYLCASLFLSISTWFPKWTCSHAVGGCTV